jgi:hypothetical protein
MVAEEYKLSLAYGGKTILNCRSGFATLPPELLQDQSAVVLLLGRYLASWLLAMDEHSGLKDLRGSGRRSVIPYVHGRTELYCSSLYESEPFFFSTPWKWRPPEPFIAQDRVVYNEPSRPDRWPGAGKPYIVGHNG